MKAVMNRITMFRYDPEKMEKWFEYMSEQGYWLSGVGVYITSYEKKTPETCQYRILQEAELVTKDRREIRRIYKEKGWELVCDGFRRQWVFRTTDPKAEAIPSKGSQVTGRGNSGIWGKWASLMIPCFFTFFGVPNLIYTVKEWNGVDLSENIVMMGISIGALAVAGLFFHGLLRERWFEKQQQRGNPEES